jgi:peptide/nickel transport system ATP-binding protein
MIQIENLTVELDAEPAVLRAIDGLTMTLERGKTFALVGESGCGKSMTALALNRLLPPVARIVGGRIRLDGQDLLDLPESQMRQVRGGRIGMIFQEPATSLNPVLKVGEQIVEAIETHTPLRGTAARAKAVEWLRRVGIPEPERRIDDYPFRMSGGQKQRVMIAITLAAEPEYVVADEPTTALDVTIQAQVLELLRELQAERGLGLMLITHDLAVVAGMAHRVALMYAGQIVEEADADHFFAAPRHPYAQALLRALPEAGRRSVPLAAIPGMVPLLSTRFEGCRFAPRCDRALARCASTVPALLTPESGRAVRCLLHEAGVVKLSVPAASPADATTATRATQPLLVVRDLSVRFAIKGGLLQRTRGHFDAVQGVSFDLPAGSTLALVGESGCGKTTTGKAIVQLLRGQAQIGGQALLDGADLFGLQGDELRRARRRVQIVFQDPFSSLNPRMRVAEVLEEGVAALLPELDPAERRARVQHLCERVGLRSEALERYPHEFSGGQRQRIAIARALAVEPALIVCDEPTSALDVSVQAQILNLMRELQREMGLAYLFITHNIGVVEYLADRIAVMQGGRIVEAGDAESVLARPNHAYTRRLLAAVPRLGPVVTV